MKKLDIIFWLFGVEYFFWFFEFGDGCFFLGDNKFVWFEVCLVVKLDEYNLDFLRGGMGCLFLDFLDFVVVDMMVLDILMLLFFLEVIVLSEFFWMISDFFKMEFLFFCLFGVVGIFE